MSFTKLLAGFVFVAVSVAIMTRVQFIKSLIYPPA